MDALEEGVARFNAREFWHAHESWESEWLRAEGPARKFLQGLIQLAAAYHHAQKGTWRGGVRLFDASLEKLQEFEDGYLGIHFRDATAAAAIHRQSIGRGEGIDASGYPKLSYNCDLSTAQRNLTHRGV